MSVQVWSGSGIEKLKTEVKNDIEDAAQGDASLRLKFILEKISGLEDLLEDEPLARRYIYVVHALVHHERFGGLKDTHLKGLFDTACAILKIRRIDPLKSRIRFLYEELYLVQSQVARKQGDAWQSAWMQRMALRHNNPDYAVHKQVAMGIRDLRLGNGVRALAEYRAVEKLDPGDRLWVRARLGQVMVLRLTGAFDECRELITVSPQQRIFKPRELRDLAWEELCVQLQLDKNIRPMLNAVKPGASHYTSYYFLEAYMWALAIHGTVDNALIPMVRSKARKRSLSVNQEGVLYKIALALENCLDSSVPYDLRLMELGEAVKMRVGLIGIDKELLTLAAACQWLCRSRVTDHAELVLDEYRAISLRLSGQATDDSLNLLF